MINKIKLLILSEFPLEGLIKYFKHTGWNIFGRIINLVIAFFVNIYVIRVLGPNNYGIISYVISFVSVFAVFSNFGVDSILYIDLANKPEKKDSILGTGFSLKFIGAISSFLIVVIYLLIASENFFVKSAMLLYALSLFGSPFTVVNSYFQSRAFSKPTVINTMVISIILSLTKVMVVLLKLDLRFFILIFVLEAIFYAIGYLYIYNKYGNNFRKWFFDKNLAKKLLKISWPLMLSSASALIYSKIDQIMLGNMLDKSAVGLYDAAVRLAEVWYFFPAIIIGSLFPAIINAKKVGDFVYKKRLSRLYSLSIYFSLIFIIPFSLFSSHIISLLYGSSYLLSSLILKVYVWSGLWYVIGVAITQYLINEKYTKIIFVSNFLPMILNIILNIILIKKIGVIGPAYATAISYAFIPLSILLFKKTRDHVVLIAKSILFKY